MTEVENLISLAAGVLFGGYLLYSISSTPTPPTTTNHHKQAHRDDDEDAAAAAAAAKRVELHHHQDNHNAGGGSTPPPSSSSSTLNHHEHTTKSPTRENNNDDDVVVPSWMSKKNRTVHEDFTEPSWMSSSSSRAPHRRETEDSSSSSSSSEEDEDDDEEYVPSWKSSSSLRKKKTASKKKHTPSRKSSRRRDGNDFTTEIPSSIKNHDERENSDDSSTMMMNGSTLHDDVGDNDEGAAPSWMSQREPSFLREEDVEPEWKSRRSIVKSTTTIRPTTKSSPASSARAHVRTETREERHHAGDETRVLSANDAVSHVAAEASDVVFVYPGVHAAAFLGEGLVRAHHLAHHQRAHESGSHPASEDEADFSNQQHAHKLSCAVKVMETRAGAGKVVVGAAEVPGARVSVLTSSLSLPHLVPSLAELVERRLPVVIHVASASLIHVSSSSSAASGGGVEDDVLVCRPGDFSDLLQTCRSLGMAVLVSGDAQEAHDFAVCAHEYAARARAPVIHALDAARTLNRVSTLSFSPLAVAARLARQQPQQQHHQRPSPSPSPAPSDHHHHSQQQLTQHDHSHVLRSALKSRGYAPFEYVGPSEAVFVVIALGPQAALLAKAVHRAQSASGPRSRSSASPSSAARFAHDLSGALGIVRVRVPKPFDAAAFLQCLPSTARRVCVLDHQAAFAGAPPSLLFSEVAAALHSPAALAHFTPLLRRRRSDPEHYYDDGSSSDSNRIFLCSAHVHPSSARGLTPGGVSELLDNLTSDYPKALLAVSAPHFSASVSAASSASTGVSSTPPPHFPHDGDEDDGENEDDDEEQSCLPGHQRARRITIWSTGHRRYGVERASRVAIEHLGHASSPQHPRNTSVISFRDDFPGTASSEKNPLNEQEAENNGRTGLTEIRLGGGEGETVTSFLPRASHVVVVDAGALSNPALDVIEPLREGGVLLLVDCDTTFLSVAQKKKAASRGAKLVRLNASSHNAGGATPWLAVMAGIFEASPTDFHVAVAHVKQAFRACRANEEHDWHALHKAAEAIEAVPGALTALPLTVSSLASSVARNTTLFFAPPPPLYGTSSSSSSAATLETASTGSSSLASGYGGVDVFGFLPRLFGSTAGDFETEASLLHSVSLTRESIRASAAAAAMGGEEDGDSAGDETSGGEAVRAVPPHQVAWTLLFSEAYETDAVLRPREHDTHQIVLTLRKRLTPEEYERNIFHLEFDISGTALRYEIGDALGVFGHNDAGEVDAFVARYNETGGDISPEAFVAFRNQERGSGKEELVPVRNLLVQHLDLFGRPSKKFYVWLAQFAKSRYEYLKLMHTGTDDTEAFKLGVSETLTYADILLQHPSARPSVAQLASAIPSIKARHYSIASSMKYTPRSVHLLVVAVDWKTPTGRTRYGQCTRYLANLLPGELVTVDVMPSVLRLPPSPKQPIVMAGLGTGMAPFRAFVQERKIQKESGIEVGPIILYFGARHRHEEWLYGDEWDGYEREGLVTKLGLAFSRDQKDKVYIQHKIVEDGPLLKRLFLKEHGFFYLCGPTWPVADVRDAVAKGIDPERFAINNDASIVEELKEQGRYILEVY